MYTCSVTMINQLKALQEKYIAAIQHKIQTDYKNDLTILKETIEAFDKENTAWDTLINAA